MTTLHISAGISMDVPDDLTIIRTRTDTGLEGFLDGGLVPDDPFVAAMELAAKVFDPPSGLEAVLEPSFVALPQVVDAADNPSDTQDRSAVVRRHATNDGPIAILEERDGQLRWLLEKAAPDGGFEVVVQRGFKRWRGWLLRLAVKVAGDKVNDWLRDRYANPTRLLQILAPGIVNNKKKSDKAIEGWAPLTSANDIQSTLSPGVLKPLPTHRSARILLWMHGTFVDTYASFGDLAVCPNGRELVARMLQNYDAVIAFDHPTLYDDPLDNAKALVGLLESRDWEHPPHFDLVTTSRGSLVARSLLERHLPTHQGTAFSFGRVVMVAPAAGGTLLASDDHWDDLLDQMTRLVRVTAKVGQVLFPGAAGAIHLVARALKGLFGLLQAMVWGVANTGLFPGLVAMDPDGDFIDKLNGAALPPDLPHVEGYWPLLSNFEPTGADIVHPPRVPALLKAADIAVDRLFNDVPSDLVNDLSNATRGHDKLKNRWKKGLHFGTNRDVHHLNFWTFEQTTTAVEGFLALERPDSGLEAHGTWNAAANYGPDPYRHGVRIAGQLYADLVELPDTLADRSTDAFLRTFFGAASTQVRSSLSRLAARDGSRTQGLPLLVVVPGLPGSHLDREGTLGRRVWLNLLQFGKGDLAEALRLDSNGHDPAPGAHPLRSPDLIRLAYQVAIWTWRAEGFEVVVAPFDWRKPLTSAADDLGRQLLKLRQTHEDIVLVCHSTGGVVASLWAKRDPDQARLVKRAVFSGVPIGGTYTALDMLSGQADVLGLLAFVARNDNRQQLTETAVSWPGLAHLLPNPKFFPNGGPSCVDPASWAGTSGPADAWLRDAQSVHAQVDTSPLLKRTHALVGTSYDTVVAARSMPLRPDTRRSQKGPGDGTVPVVSAVHNDLASVHIAASLPHVAHFYDPAIIAATMALAQGTAPGWLLAASADGLRKDAWEGRLASRPLKRPDPREVVRRARTGSARHEDLLQFLAW